MLNEKQASIYVKSIMEAVYVQVPIENIDDTQLSYQIHSVLERFQTSVLKNVDEKPKPFNYCPHCGLDLHGFRITP